MFFDLALYTLKGIDKNKIEAKRFLFAKVEANASKFLYWILLIFKPIIW